MAMLRYDLAHEPRVAGEWRARAAASETMMSRDQQGAMVRLSVVVPAKDEADSLAQLVDEIVSALRPMFGCGRFEILVVDDGSLDETRMVLEELTTVVPELRGLVMAENVGQSAATVAGIRMARGEWIATLDADLQNDPADLVRLWEALGDDHDVVLGWRAERRDCWSKRLVSWCANLVRNKVLGQSIRDTGCSVRIIRRSAALRLPVFRGMHRFFGPLLLRDGCRVVQVSVGHRPRTHGRSHYSILNRSVRVMVDLMGVAWLMSRPVRYQVKETVRSGGCGLEGDSLAATGKEMSEGWPL